MDFASRHYAHLPRRFGVHPPIQGIGHIPRKTEWVYNVFDTFNYSFIVRGSGIYRRDGTDTEVVAPCVITQWPGEYVEYGPTTPPGYWEEIFIRYRPEDLSFLETHALVDNDRPVWRIGDLQRLTIRLTELADLTHRSESPGAADRIDAACMGAVMESLLTRHVAPLDEHAEAIRMVRRTIQNRFLDSLSLEQLAEAAGMSVTTFRRYWTKHVQVPPGRYILGLRIAEARRLLVETTLPVSSIARRVRFNDPLYFSRRFRLETGTSPLEYRTMHRLELEEQH